MRATAILPLPARPSGRSDAVFTPVAGQPPLIRVVRTLGYSADVVVAAAEPLVGAVREVLGAHGLSAIDVVVADAPGERRQCVQAGLSGIAARASRLVLLHDIGWPVFGPEIAERVLATLRDGAAAVMPVLLVTDSVKAVDTRGTLTATLDRSQLRTVQYPRGFDGDVLAALAADGPDDFDDLQATLSGGIPVVVIDGDADALNVELPRDADYLAAVIDDRLDPPAR